jgi:hypothetical protein
VVAHHAVDQVDHQRMIIDLTGSVPLVIPCCDGCSRDREVFHLIETSEWLCRECFALAHA